MWFKFLQKYPSTTAVCLNAKFKSTENWHGNRQRMCTWLMQFNWKTQKRNMPIYWQRMNGKKTSLKTRNKKQPHTLIIKKKTKHTMATIRQKLGKSKTTSVRKRLNSTWLKSEQTTIQQAMESSEKKWLWLINKIMITHITFASSLSNHLARTPWRTTLSSLLLPDRSSTACLNRTIHRDSTAHGTDTVYSGLVKILMNLTWVSANLIWREFLYSGPSCGYYNASCSLTHLRNYQLYSVLGNFIDSRALCHDV